MRLISPFRDIYDVWLRDQDHTTTWVRASKVIVSIDKPTEQTVQRNMLRAFHAAYAALEEMPAMWQVEYGSRTPRRVGTRCVLGVAGKLYGVYCDGSNLNAGLQPTNAFPGYPEYREYIEQFSTYKDNPDYYKASQFRKPVDQPHRVWADSHLLFGARPFDGNLAGWVEWRKKYDTVDTGSEPHLAADAPCYAVFRTAVYSNPCLKTFNQHKIVEPFLLAQQIEQYLTNQLAKQADPIPVRTQDLIRDAHGFNKDSFRNTKPDRRTRKQ